MTKAEYNEYRYIRSQLKKLKPEGGSLLTIRTSGSVEYKEALHDLYTEWGFHPTAVEVNRRYFDDERIMYIYGLTFEIEGEEHSWRELYSKEQKDAFAAALC